MSRWIGSATSQTFAFMPATTWSASSHKAMHSRLAASLVDAGLSLEETTDTGGGR